jgi:hypothetical protein
MIGKRPGGERQATQRRSGSVPCRPPVAADRRVGKRAIRITERMTKMRRTPASMFI